jgi:hypothetical protein
MDLSEYAPFGRRFPGLAPATPGSRPSSIARHVNGYEGRLGLVPVRRPADVLAAVGWAGSANYTDDPEGMTVVLRSWEYRFDAYLIALGFDIITLAVARPPLDQRTALRIAAEHFAFCPDNIWQGIGTVRKYAEYLVNLPRWDFWWD